MNKDKELKKAIKQTLDYMIAEGMVVKIGNEYRLKTKKELQKELHKLLNP